MLPCFYLTYQLDNNGCSTQEVNITELQPKKRHHRVQLFHVNATVTEEGTGMWVNKNIDDEAVKTDTFSHWDGGSKDTESKQLSNQLRLSMLSLISSSGLEFSRSGTTKIERITNKLIFLKADSHFRHGIPFFVKVRYFLVHSWFSCRVALQNQSHSARY